ncbi:MAG: recombinase family protein [Marinisporobacter sp.]|nr:recombinase family protein [Marinisporobacter sp.]
MKSQLEKMTEIEKYIKTQQKLNHPKDKNKEKEEKPTPYEPTPEDYAAVYARKSGPQDTFSIPSQLEDCKKFIKGNNLILYDSYQDKKSGRKMRFYDRPGFKKLLNDLAAGMFKTVILTRRDRLSRRVDDFMQIRRIFRHYDVRVFYVNEGELVSSQHSYLSSFLENMLIAISTLEPENIVRRTTDGRQFLRNDGIYQSRNYPPYGYNKKEGEKHEFEEIPQQIDIAKKIFASFMIFPCTDIDYDIAIKQFADQMNTIENSDRKFSKQFIIDFLQRPVYGGKIRKMEIDDIEDFVEWDEENERYILLDEGFRKCTNIDGLISWEDWKTCYLKFYQLKYGIPEPQYLFRNLLYCQKCDAPIQLQKGTNIYSCTQECTNIDIDLLIYKIFHQVIFDCDNAIIQGILKKKLDTLNTEIRNQKNDLTIKEQKLRKQIDHYAKSMTESNREKITELQKKIQKVRHNINNLGQEKALFINAMNNLPILKEQLTDFSLTDTIYFQKNWQTYQDLLIKFISKVVLQPKGHDYTINIQYI